MQSCRWLWTFNQQEVCLAEISVLWCHFCSENDHIMSFLFQQSERPPKRRKKYDGGNSKSTEKDEISSKPYDNLIVIGYQSKIFRDDLVAKYIEDGKHLITWMGDESLLVDR